VTSYSYVFAFDTSQLRGGHRLRPGGLATVIRQALAPQSWGWILRPTRLVLALRRPYFFSCTSTWIPLKSLNILSLPLADFIAPADCSSWELRLLYVNLRLWEGQTSPWRPVADVTSPFSSTLTYPSTRSFGTLAPLGQAYKLFLLLRLNRRWTSIPACSVDRRWTSLSSYAVFSPNVSSPFYGLPLPPVSTPTSCLYGLPLWPISTASLHHIIVNIVIVIVHFLFKRNIYFSLYVILYVLLSFGIIFLLFSF
jgi:hypothetical protein